MLRDRIEKVEHMQEQMGMESRDRGPPREDQQEESGKQTKNPKQNKTKKPHCNRNEERLDRLIRRLKKESEDLMGQQKFLTLKSKENKD